MIHRIMSKSQISRSQNNPPPKKNIWFKKDYSLTGMYASRGDEQTYDVPNNPDAQIIFWHRKLPGKEKQKGDLCCSAIIKKAIKDDVYEMFVTFDSGFLPKPHPANVSLPHALSLMDKDAVIEKDGKLPTKWGIPLKLMPNKFQDLYSRVSQETYTLIKTLVKSIRWMQAATGKANPLASVSFKWSFDGQHWKSLPSDIYATMTQSEGIDLTEKKIKFCIEEWSKGSIEPLAHELVREAFGVLGSGNPRSALLIANSALETGLKHYLSYLMPQSEYLLEKIPSPPSLSIIQEVIPNIHAERKIEAQGIPLEKEEAEFLKKWISLRNQVAHGVLADLKANEVTDFLNFVRKNLYNLDSLRGHDWAKKVLVPYEG